MCGLELHCPLRESVKTSCQENRGSSGCLWVLFPVVLQAPGLTISATLAINSTRPQVAAPVCPNATCYYATPVWVPANSSAPGDEAGTVYVATYPRQPAYPGGGDSGCADAATSDGSSLTLQPDDLSLTGLSVAVTSVVLPPGPSMVGATLDFWGADPFNVTTRQWNASAADIDAAVKWATAGFNPSVSRQG